MSPLLPVPCPNTRSWTWLKCNTINTCQRNPLSQLSLWMVLKIKLWCQLKKRLVVNEFLLQFKRLGCIGTDRFRKSLMSEKLPTLNVATNPMIVKTHSWTCKLHTHHETQTLLISFMRTNWLKTRLVSSTPWLKNGLKSCLMSRDKDLTLMKGVTISRQT